MKIPKISVIIPVFNKERFLARCIRSISSQTLSKDDYEIIIVDDGSTDNSIKAIQRFSEDVVFLQHKKNKGLPAALNTGIKSAKGQFIVRLDADDYAHEEYLNVLSLALRMNNDIDAVACDYILVNEKQDQIKTVNCLEEPIGCGIMYRAEQLIDLGMYDETFIVHEDKELKLRFDRKYSMTRIPIPLYRYFIHGENLTSDKDLMSRYEEALNKKHPKR